jgi:hydrogenase maturation protein HypF
MRGRATPGPSAGAVVRVRASFRGVVQGVGFRPFVYRLARDLGLRGWVGNSPEGASAEFEGPPDAWDEFRRRLPAEMPAHAVLERLELDYLPPAGYASFDIRPSAASGARTAGVLPDLAVCDDCAREVLDPADRRHRYPFTNCTRCGPRWSILLSLPYDRPNTTMARFPLCADCRREYEDPSDRRFHAQPTACAACGPRLQALDAAGRPTLSGDEALRFAAASLRMGAVLALKGLGGFQLLVDARNDAAVRRLRERKGREAKPLAVMFDSLEDLGRSCRADEAEAALWRSAEAPIVLLARLDGAATAPSVAPGLRTLGAMRPTTPLHLLLLREAGFPVVATSGNRSEEPICVDEGEAVERLGGVADLFLSHDRPVARPVDDSVARVVCGGAQLLRRARGYAPRPPAPDRPVRGVLATGGHGKCAVGFSLGGALAVSQHIGDLGSARADDLFRATVADFARLGGAGPARVAVDMHPDYPSSNFGRSLGLPVTEVQHHHAHVVSVMAEHGLRGPVLGVAWDGAGYGPDGTVWGGEFFRAGETDFARFAAFRRFRLPGGDAAAREPRRSALAVLRELGVAADDALLAALGVTPAEAAAWERMMERGVNAPVTTSAGRLFDAMGALLGFGAVNSYEGQTALAMEAAAADGPSDAYPFPLRGGAEPFELDWGPLVLSAWEDRRRGVPPGVVSARFHDGLVEGVVAAARAAGLEAVALSGGCFQNRRLLERAVERLRREGFRPYWNRAVPPNDGGLALGQAVAAGA